MGPPPFYFFKLPLLSKIAKTISVQRLLRQEAPSVGVKLYLISIPVKKSWVFLSGSCPLEEWKSCSPTWLFEPSLLSSFKSFCGDAKIRKGKKKLGDEEILFKDCEIVYLGRRARLCFLPICTLMQKNVRREGLEESLYMQSLYGNL